MSRPLSLPPVARPGVTLRAELERLGRHYKELPLSWEMASEPPDELEPLAQSVLAEALRNADKHARPTTVSVRVSHERDTFTLEVRNDGVTDAGGPGARMGLRLAALEALQRGGVLEFGPAGPAEWRVRLMVPIR